MKISKKKYVKIMEALDGIRCDMRENRHLDAKYRQIDDDVMQYIERKGYCTYILTRQNLFARVLTPAGYEVLSTLDYGKYKRKKIFENGRLWIPVVISIVAAIISAVALYVQTNKVSKLEGKFDELQIQLNQVSDANTENQDKIIRVVSQIDSIKYSQADTAIKKPKRSQQ